jgi:hypothetical protein
MNEEQMQSLLDAWHRDREIPRPKVQASVAEVMASVPRTRQRGRWWPLPAFERPVSTFPTRELAPVPIPATIGPTPERGFTMFSALKFITAAVIVALFGGFLLAGIFTTPQGDEVLPAAVTASPSPMTAEELLSGVVTEEVEPGVYRVVNDGVRDLADLFWGVPAPSSTIVAGQDGSIWLDRSGDLVRLGYPQTPAPSDDEFDDLVTFSVAPDGTVWAVVQRGGWEWRLQSLDGDTWTTHHESAQGPSRRRTSTSSPPRPWRRRRSSHYLLRTGATGPSMVAQAGPPLLLRTPTLRSLSYLSTAVRPTELRCVPEMARCLADLRAGRWPE